MKKIFWAAMVFLLADKLGFCEAPTIQMESADRTILGRGIPATLIEASIKRYIAHNSNDVGVHIRIKNTSSIAEYLRHIGECAYGLRKFKMWE